MTLPQAFAYEDHGTTHAFPPIDRESATLELAPVEGGFDLTVSVSETWLRGRTFPIVLDPTLSFSSFRVDEGGKEMYAFQSPSCGSEGCSGNTGPATGAGSYNHAGITVAPMRSYFKFDLSSIPERSVITDASLDLFLWGCLGDLYAGGIWTCNDVGDVFTLEARPMFEDWFTDDGYLESNADVEEGNVWARHTQAAFPKSQTGSGNTSNPIWHRFDIAKGVQEWVSRIRPNEGVQIRVAQDGTSNWGGPEWPTSASGASADYAKRPKLEVTWAPPAAGFGYEPWWSYAEEAIGPQGKASVNVANGNLVVQQTDSTPVQARGRLGYVARRTYNSQDTKLAAFPASIGEGWRLNLGEAGDAQSLGVEATGLELTPGDSFTNPLYVTMIDRDGTEHVFAPQGLGGVAPLDLDNLTGALKVLSRGIQGTGGLLRGTNLCVEQAYKPPPGVHLGLWRYIDVGLGSCATATSGQIVGFATMTPDRVRSVFDAFGRIVSMSDAAGNELRYKYELDELPTPPATGRLERVFEPKCSSSGAAPCRAFRFSYDTVVGTAPNQVTIEDSAGRDTVYEISNVSGHRLLSRVVNPDGTDLEYTYGGCGGTSTQLCSVSDPRGNVTEFAYSSGKVSSITDRSDATTTLTYAGSHTNVDRATHRARYTLTDHEGGLDPSGRVSKIEEGSTADSYLRQTLLYWDTSEGCRQPDFQLDNNLCQVIRRATPNTSDPARDEVTTFTYNPEGRVLVEQRQAESADSISTFGYRTQYVPPTGPVVVVNDSVAGGGKVTSGPRPTGLTLFSISDRVESLTPRGNASGATPATYKSTNKVDANENVDAGSAPTGTVCTNPDSAASNTGLLCESETPAPNGSGRPVTRYTYDTSGLRASMTSPKAIATGQTSERTTYTYYADATNDLSGTSSAGGWLKAVTDPDDNFVAFAYDAAGNVVRTWDRNATEGLAASAFPGTVASPPSTAFTQELYASGADQQAMANPWRYLRSSSDQLRNETTYEVDANGNPTRIRPPRGNDAGTGNFDTTQVFDTRDLLTERSDPAPDGSSGALPERFGYDVHGNNIWTKDRRDNVRVVVYDDVNRQIEERFTRGKASETTTPAGCRGFISSDAPIASDRVVCVRAFGYDGVDNLTSSTDATGATTTYSYDALHRRTTQLTPRNAGGLTTVRTAWLYDPDGNVTDTCSPREFNEGSGSCTATGAYSEHLFYDPAGMIRERKTYREAGSSQTTTFAYDADGNVTSETDPRGVTVTHAYDLLDRRTSTTTPRDASTSFTTRYLYDPAGNTTALARPGSVDTGSGSDGDLVVGSANPSNNPFVVPTGKEYSSVTLENGGWITSGTSGVLDFRVADKLSVCSTCGITVAGKGSSGGAAGQPSSGNGSNGNGISSGYGRSGQGGQVKGGGGGGAGHAASGTAGSGSGVGSGTGGVAGSSYGSADEPTDIGSGGGGGGAGLNGAGGQGGTGGGAVRITAATIDLLGSIKADGTAGANGVVSLVEGGGGGGGGSGGSVWLSAHKLNMPTSGAVSTAGGAGGTGFGGNNGGSGAKGRVSIDSAILTGAGTAQNSTNGSFRANQVERVTAYSYDAAHRLKDTVEGSDSYTASSAGPFDQTRGANVRTRNFYDADSNMVGRLLPRAFTSSTATPSTSPHLERTDYERSGRPSIVYSPRFDPTAAPDLTSSSTQSTECPTGSSPAVVTDVPGYPSATGVCQTRVEYDANGDQAKLHMPTAPGGANRHLVYVYTDDRLLKSVDAPSPEDGARIISAAMAYDAEGRMVARCDALGHCTAWEYTQDGLVKKLDEEEAGTLNYDTTFGFDASGNQTSVTDALSKVWSTTYYADGLTKEVKDPLLNTTKYVYDPAGSPAEVYSPAAVAHVDPNPAGIPVKHTYLLDGLLSATTEPVANDGTIRRETTYSYDPGGLKTAQRVREVDASQNPIAGRDDGFQRFAYDAVGRQRIQYGRGGESIDTTFDAEANSISIQDSASSSTISSSFYLDGLPREVSDGMRSTRHAYDGAGMPASLVERVDATGTILATTTHGYSDAGLPSRTTSTRSPGEWNYGYDDAGHPLGFTAPDGISNSVAWNADDTLASSTVKSGQATRAAFSYTHDELKRITLQNYSGDPASGGAHVADDFSFAYDDAGRLDSFSQGATAKDVAYDADSNRTKWSEEDFRYRADASILDVDLGTDYTYRPFGGLASGGGVTYTYDGFDRTTEIDPTGTEEATFSYDGLDRQRHRGRTKPSGATEETDFYYLAGAPTLLGEAPGGSDTSYILEPFGSPLAASRSSLHHLADDGYGNISTALTTGGSVACTLRYSPFADPVSAQGGDDGNPCNTGSTHSNVLYRGSRRDPTSGTYQFGSRTYDPSGATFLTPDADRGGSSLAHLSIGVDPLTRNRYAYVNGDPVNLFDPTGHIGCSTLTFGILKRACRDAVDTVKTGVRWVEDKVDQGIDAAKRFYRRHEETIKTALKVTAVVGTVVAIGVGCAATVGAVCAAAAGIGAAIGAGAGAALCPTGTSTLKCAGVGAAAGAVGGAGAALVAPAIAAALPTTLSATTAGVISASGAGATAGASGSIVGQFAATGDISVTQVARDAVLGAVTGGTLKRLGGLLRGRVLPRLRLRAGTEAPGEYVDLTTPARRTHILYGDETGGGHLWPGNPGKTPFPQSWSRARILHEISDVATDPAASRVQLGSRTIVSGLREDVQVRVFVDNNTGEIVTGYPINLPRNP